MFPIDEVTRSASRKDQVRKVGAQIDKTALHNVEDFFNSMLLQFPEPPLEQPRHALQLDAGYLRAVPAKCSGWRSFAVIEARLRNPDGPSASIAYVNDETWSVLDRFHHFLHQHEVPIDAAVAIIGDGGEDVAYRAICLGGQCNASSIGFIFRYDSSTPSNGFVACAINSQTTPQHS